MNIEAQTIPAGFLIGCASGAQHVEGGLNNDWTRMETTVLGSIHDGSVSGIACDQYVRYRSDLDVCARELHNNAHRFSVEWSRVEPDEGVFSADALRHYRDVAHTCREMGMEPIVTLHHFTLPTWLADRGGVAALNAPRLFARFTAAVVAALGDEVTWWVTVNEPMVYVVMSRLLGVFPPNQSSLPEALEAARGLLRMHAAAARAIRTVARASNRTARISIAHHERPLKPVDPRSPLDRVAAWMPNFLFNRWFLRSCMAGRMLPPVGKGEPVPGLRGSLDYIGLNYYTEERVRFDSSATETLFSRQTPRDDVPADSFGNSVDPEGLARALSALWREFHLPVLITENGVADDHDELRSRYILEHLAVVLDAIESGIDVRGYLYWTQMDNYEWAEGYSQRFGLYSVDRETLERRPKPSAAVFAQICETRHLAPVTV